MTTRRFPVGAYVRKNDTTWVSNEFDSSWGRGVGVGCVVHSPFPLDDGEADVRWPTGRCFEDTSGLRIVTPSFIQRIRLRLAMYRWRRRLAPDDPNAITWRRRCSRP